jgi:hypothetical protein
MRIILLSLSFLLLGELSGYAQTGAPMQVPAQAVSQLEDLKELTKSTVEQKAAKKHANKLPAESRPDLNRYLVISADDFVRVTTAKPTKEAYLECLDRGLARLAPLTATPTERKQVAEYYQELMEIVGLPSSEGRLDAFIAQPSVAK